MENDMTRAYLIVLLLTMSNTHISVAQNVKITGLGASNCAKYINDIESNETSEKTYFAWAQGFMNGALVRAPAGIDDNLDLIPRSFPVVDQMSFLKNWCRSNRDSDFSNASFALFKELRAQMPK